MAIGQGAHGGDVGLEAAGKEQHPLPPQPGREVLLPLFVATITTASVQQDWVQHVVEGGQLHAERPQLITPDYLHRALDEDFGERAGEKTGRFDLAQARPHRFDSLRAGARGLGDACDVQPAVAGFVEAFGELQGDPALIDAGKKQVDLFEDIDRERTRTAGDEVERIGTPKVTEAQVGNVMPYPMPPTLRR